jgi:hypothetical protein
MLVGGCALREALTPTEDSLSTWSDRPLAPSPDLATRATDPNSTCSAGHDGLPVRILLQDRRTEATAAFLVAGATTFGSCLVTSAGGGSGGGSGPLPGPMTRPLTIDANGGGGVGAGDARELGGRVDPKASSVVIELADGRSVVASLANGYWLAWWPGSVPAEHVVATDGAGTEVASVEVPL